MVRREHARVRAKSPRRASSPAAASSQASQRDRLLSAATELAGSSGAASLTVGRVIAHAEISRATFYGHFTDVEQCLLAALAPIRRRLLVGIRRAVASDRPERAAMRAVQSVLDFADARPDLARLLLCETATAGGRVRCIRDELVEQTARIVEEAQARASANALLPDLPPWLVLAVGCRLIASRLQGDERGLQDLREGLPGWIAAYESPVACHRWQAVRLLPPPARSPFLPPYALRPPAPVPSGSTRLSARIAAEDNWLRIVFATAEVVGRDGFPAATVAAITDAADVDSSAFYRLFSGKDQALAAACEMFFRHTIAVTAGAFTSGESWRERLWEAARALLQYAGANPAFAYVSLIESEAGGTGALRRVDERMRAFTIFLQDGPHQPSWPSAETTATQSADITLEAIAAAVFELGSRHARENGGLDPSNLVAPVVFVALTPFSGASAAYDFVRARAPEPDLHTLLVSVA
jgi:AcrR family transcriptional regulator